MKPLLLPLVAGSFATAAFLVPVPQAGPSAPAQVWNSSSPSSSILPTEEDSRIPLRSDSRPLGLVPLSGEEGALLDAIAHESTRGQVIPAALARPGTAIWVLRRLEEADFHTSQARSVGWLLRGVLLLRDSLPDGLPLPLDSYLSRVFGAGSLHRSAAEAVIWAWHGIRLLDSHHEELVSNTRPSFPAASAFHSRLHLALLEDLLRAFLEEGSGQRVEQSLQDPWPEVRSLARRLLLEDGRSWQSIVAASSLATPTEIRVWGNALAKQLPPQEAAQALLHLEALTQAEELFSPWSLLASRSPGAVGKAWEDLLATAAVPETAPSLDSSWQEGKIRQRVLLALAVGAPGDPTTRGTLDRATWQEPNPLVRISAWSALAEAADQKSRSLALARLQAPDRQEALSLGSLGTAPLVEGLRALARTATPSQRSDLVAVLGTLGLNHEIQAELRHMLTGL